MFVEELLESWVVSELKALNSSLSPAFKAIEPLGVREISPETAGDFVKIAPAALVSLASVTPSGETDALGVYQAVDVSFRVDVIVDGKFKPLDTAAVAFGLGRRVKNLLRGRIYKQADGDEPGGVIRWTGSTYATLDSTTLLIGIQGFNLTIIDTPLAQGTQT